MLDAVRDAARPLRRRPRGDRRRHLDLQHRRDRRGLRAPAKRPTPAPLPGRPAAPDRAHAAFARRFRAARHRAARAVRHRRDRVLVEREGVRAGRAPDPGRAGRRRAGRRRRYACAAACCSASTRWAWCRTDPCRPFDAARDGLSLGEAGGFALLERAKTARRPACAARLRRIQRRAPHVRAASRRPRRATGDAAMRSRAPASTRPTSATSTCTAPRRRPTTAIEAQRRRRDVPRRRCMPVRPRAGPGTRSARPASSNRCSRCSRWNTACCRASSTARSPIPPAARRSASTTQNATIALRDEQFLRLRRQQLLAGVRAHDRAA